ncbi:MAG: hypothetical protein ABIR39_01960 [Nocardioides sp.]|uniref:DUF6912 family protein n=1 Tax=Nocardioides sp. TaxID=35761 RepID=UPI0032638F66
MRVYLPLTLDLLARAVETGAVDADVEKIVAEDESEEAEYAALMTAADASAALIERPGRRVVLVADVVDAAGAVPEKWWAAVHVDTEDDADPDDDLAWYATQEISDVLAGR